jgi:streptogramin lyase
MAVFGPYGIATTPDDQEFFASLSGSYLDQIDVDTDGVTVLEPPMPHQGSRRI